MKKLLAIFVFGWLLSAQQAPLSEQPAPGAVRGMVIDVTTQEPLAKVKVDMASDAGESFIVWTDDEGKFAIEQVAPGRHSLNIFRNGYASVVEGIHGSVRPLEMLDVGPGEVIDDLVFGMRPAAVITGRVVDEDGDAFEGLMVEAFQLAYENGRRAPRVRGIDRTNDRGEYRIYGLAPGKYYVRIDMGPLGRLIDGRRPTESASGYVDTYYPNGYDVAEARPLQLSGQAETTGIDFRMLPTKTFSLSGQIVDGATGRPSRNTQARLLDRTLTSSQTPMAGRLTSIVRNDGRFRVGNLRPGNYRLEAVTISTDGSRLAAFHDFDLSDRSLEDVLIETKPTFSVPLSVTIEGEFDRPATPLPLFLQPAGAYSEFRRVRAREAENGEILFQSVSPESYRVRAGNIGGLHLKSALYGGRDALHEFVRVDEDGGEFEVVLSANGAQLEGRISRNGEGISGAVVVLVPEDRERREVYKNGTTDQYGAFSLIGITPGRYKVFAWERIETGAWLDPNVLREVESSGERVELEERDVKSVTPKLIEDKD